jgi:hypothetical protein
MKSRRMKSRALDIGRGGFFTLRGVSGAALRQLFDLTLEFRKLIVNVAHSRRRFAGRNLNPSFFSAAAFLRVGLRPTASGGGGGMRGARGASGGAAIGSKTVVKICLVRLRQLPPSLSVEAVFGFNSQRAFQELGTFGWRRGKRRCVDPTVCDDALSARVAACASMRI